MNALLSPAGRCTERHSEWYTGHPAAGVGGERDGGHLPPGAHAQGPRGGSHQEAVGAPVRAFGLGSGLGLRILQEGESDF